jgi:ubiquinone/menaquinone biosynthesis C-methylase UbiE
MPQPIDYDRLAADYARHRRVHPEVLRNLIAGGGLNADSRVLEVGCGTGNYAVALEALVHCACWGIDPSEQMLAQARPRSGRIRFALGRAEQLAFPPAAFDLVFSVDVIHHVAGRAAYFREARRVLRPGGRLCTVTDSEWVIRHRQPLAVYFPETVEVELARYPRVPEIVTVMRAAGFQETSERLVEFPYRLADAQPYRDRAFSSLHLIPPEAYARGLERLEADLQRGPIPCVARYVLIWGRV